MCTYTFTLDDKLVERVRPAFRDDNALQKWLQSQMEILFMQFAEKNLPKKSAFDTTSDKIAQLGRLTEDWDGYGAPKISKKAINNAQIVLKGLPDKTYLSMDILPTEYGGVQMKYNTQDGLMLSCNFGDENMSYYVDKKGEDTIYRSFLPYNNDNISQFKMYLTT